MRRKLCWRIAARLPQTIDTSGSTSQQFDQRPVTCRAAEQTHGGEQHARP